jgi:hypothetical protein
VRTTDRAVERCSRCTAENTVKNYNVCTAYIAVEISTRLTAENTIDS